MKILGLLLMLNLFLGCVRLSQEEIYNMGPNDVIDEAALLEVVADRHGKVLLLNVWATWCTPCVEEMPHLTRLAKEYRHRPVEFIGLSVDYADEIDNKIRPFIKKHKINFRIVVQNFTNSQAIIDSLNNKWSGAVPATFIYDAQAKQKAFLLGKQNYRDLKRQLDAVLGGI